MKFSSKLVEVVRRIQRSQWSAYYLALFLLALFVLYPRLNTGFTTQDDSDIAFMAKSWHRLVPYAWNFATEQGRFFGVFLIVDLAVPYLVDSRLYYYSLTIAAIVCNMACFYALVKTIFRSSQVALLITALAFAFLQNGWQHNPLTSYPFAYSMAMSCLLGSFLFFIRWQESSRVPFGVIAAVLYFLALLTTEAFATYCIVFFCVSVAGCWDVTPVWQRAKRTARFLLPIGISLLVYGLLHIAFRIKYPSQYEGDQLASGSLWRVVAVIWQYGVSTLPGYLYFRDPLSMGVTYDGISPPVWGLRQLINNLRVEWIAKAAVLFWLSAALLRSRRTLLPGNHARLLPLGILAVFAPVTLVGFTIKYQRWVIEAHSLAGIHSYFAYFATIFVIGLLILVGRQVTARWEKASAIYPFVVGCVLAILSLATDNYNYYITRDQQLSDLKWRLIDQVVRTEEVKAIPDGALLYAPSLWSHRGIVENRPNYWSAYLSWRTGKTLKVFRTEEGFSEARRQSPGAPLYFVSFEQEPNESDQFLLFAKIPPIAALEGRAVYSTGASLFTLSKNKTFLIVGHCKSDQPPIVRVNGELVTEIDANIFAYRVRPSTPMGMLTRATLESNYPIDVASVIISFFPVTPNLSTFTIEYGSGFYGLEKDEAKQLIWNWASGDAEMSIWNRSGLRLDTCIELEVTTLTSPRTVKLFAEGYERSLLFTSHPGASKVSIPLSLVPGENKIYFKSGTPAYQPGNGDPRSIAFGVQNAKLCSPKQ